jgi:spore coat polysaccharide biosynthesis protein SpsF (cytidylyltransferase family)
VSGWFSRENDIKVKVAILVPYGDPIKQELSHKYTILEGPEDDVLARYGLAVNHFNPDYICRVTGDCAWLPGRIISKCIRDGIKTDSDYCSNVLVRSYVEGFDCEVMSRNAFDWSKENAKTAADKEHVTSLLVRAIKEGTAPKDFKVHTFLSEIDLSEVKTSIDTREEYENAVRSWELFQKKKYLAASYGSVTN